MCRLSVNAPTFWVAVDAVSIEEEEESGSKGHDADETTFLPLVWMSIL